MKYEDSHSYRMVLSVVYYHIYLVLDEFLDDKQLFTVSYFTLVDF